MLLLQRGNGSKGLNSISKPNVGQEASKVDPGRIVNSSPAAALAFFKLGKGTEASKSKQAPINPNQDKDAPRFKAGMDHYKNYAMFNAFISPVGNILPRSETGLDAKTQRKVAKCIRRLQNIGLLGNTHQHPRTSEWQNPLRVRR
jgi:ribosomal protein S18